MEASVHSFIHRHCRRSEGVEFWYNIVFEGTEHYSLAGNVSSIFILSPPVPDRDPTQHDRPRCKQVPQRAIFISSAVLDLERWVCRSQGLEDGPSLARRA